MRTSLLVLLFLFGCSRGVSKSQGAKADFAKRYSCPEERVEVKERSDVHPADLLAPDTKEEPPAEVKKDPGRLAKWQADKKEQRAKTESGYKRSYTIFEAHGCRSAVTFVTIGELSAGWAYAIAMS